MSASDAAPLPRLGEVFFDVRGDSRTMRLSWYADTDVAVFSIWQGGRCTGTFRLPMDDLSRMIEILQRGPDGRSGRRTGERRPAGGAADNTVVHSPGPHSSGPDRPARGTGEYGPGEYGPGEYGAGEYGAGEYGPGEYRSGEYRPDEYRQGDYGATADSRSARHRTERYEPDEYGRRDYEQPATEHWQDPDHYQPDRTGQRYAPESGYGHQRFEPQYGSDSSEAGFMEDPEYRQSADPASRSRHSAGRHGGGNYSNRG